MTRSSWLFLALAGCGEPLIAVDHALTAEFSRDGVRVRQATGAFALSLRGWGRPDELAEAVRVSPSEGTCAAPCLTRVSYARAGIVEWWESRPEGLEQGFTIDVPPVGSGPLVFEIGIDGAVASIASDGLSARIVLPSGEHLSYRELAAWDAEGRELPAWMESSPHGVRLVVDDAGAVGTVTVDPLLTTGDPIQADQIAAQLGWSVSSAGDVNADGFADILVGAPFFDNGQTDEGRVLVYFGSEDGAAPNPAWSVESNQAGALLGYSVAGAGDVNGDGYDDVIVGAEAFSNGETAEGRAFVYLGSAVGLAGSPAWTGEGNQLDAGFGNAVASAGDVNADGYDDVVIGANGYDNGETQEGRGFLYLGSPVGLGALPAWTAEGDQDFAEFGQSVAGAGDVDADGFADVLVGAPGITSPESGEGRAYLFLGSAGGLVSPAAWTAESDQANAFSGAVAGAGDVDGDGYGDVLVGAYAYSNGENDEGRVSMYRGSALGLASAAAWTAEGNQVSANFGWSVASVGDVNGDGLADVVVGAKLYDDGQMNEGQVSIYLGSPAGLALTAETTLASDQIDARIGYSVAGAGDVNGDGYADLIAGAYLYDQGQIDEGAAFLSLGSCLDETADLDVDGVGDRCDRCPGQDDAADADADAAPDACDLCPGEDDREDRDFDGVPDSCDLCPEDADSGQEDVDGDGVGNACDLAPLDPAVCADGDGDFCDDCSVGPVDVTADGTDTDADGQCDFSDPDDDGDTVPDGPDDAPTDPNACHDLDNDQCDDCVSGVPDEADDGPDADRDGYCDLGDPDDDNDTVPDASDLDPLDPRVCRDGDLDGCEDCLSGIADGDNDGTDTEGDGLCDAGDPDDDNDGVDDATDPFPFDITRCGDVDFDNCDDCTNGPSAPGSDGPDVDGDGLCNPGDDDDDGDTVLDVDDLDPLDPQSCADVDADRCNDCSTGLPVPLDDGLDTDLDGLCDLGDDDDDGDGVLDATDPSPLDALLCGDSDIDTCDDCSEGADTDADGSCDAGDDDDDGDTVSDALDAAPLDSLACGDADEDGCDDCIGGAPDPAADGTDSDEDGACDVGDADDDDDGVADADDPAPLDSALCADADEDGCDDCDLDCSPPELIVLDPVAEGDEKGCGCDAGAPSGGFGIWAAALALWRRRLIAPSREV